MEFDHEGTRVICVSHGINGKWDVSEKGAEAPLASFQDKEDAYAYAAELKKFTEDSTVVVEDEEGFSLLPIPLPAQEVFHGVARAPPGETGDEPIPGRSVY